MGGSALLSSAGPPINFTSFPRCPNALTTLPPSFQSAQDLHPLLCTTDSPSSPPHPPTHRHLYLPTYLPATAVSLCSTQVVIYTCPIWDIWDPRYTDAPPSKKKPVQLKSTASPQMPRFTRICSLIILKLNKLK